MGVTLHILISFVHEMQKVTWDDFSRIHAPIIDINSTHLFFHGGESNRDVLFDKSTLFLSFATLIKLIAKQGNSSRSAL